MSTYLSALLTRSCLVLDLLFVLKHNASQSFGAAFNILPLSSAHIRIYMFFLFCFCFFSPSLCSSILSDFNTNVVFGMCACVQFVTFHFQTLDHFCLYLKSLEKPTALDVSKRRPRVISQMFNVYLELACRTSYVHIVATGTQCLSSVYIP